MTSKGLRRLAADHASLHTKGLPPNYLWPPGADDSFSDLTSLTILLAGATGTPFATGLFTLTLNIPTTYPQSAPTASFKTKIFHPNVDPSSGAVCVETLKRDWKPELTLRDILITIGCLLVFPNAASALNAEAGRLVEGDFAGYERKARLWAGMHAAVPPALREAVEEAQKRGEDVVNPEAGPSDDRRRRKELQQQKRPESEDVFVREDSTQTTPPKQPARMAAPPAPQPRGLGIDMPDSSMNALLETPTQPPPMRRRKKAGSSQEDEEQNAPLPTSFASTLPTPTPGVRPLLHSNPSTPRLGRPEAKRRRVTPDDEVPEHVEIRGVNQSDVATWSDWQTLSPLSSPEDARSRKRRHTLEQKRLESVEGSIDAYNAGQFGPRLGVSRL